MTYPGSDVRAQTANPTDTAPVPIAPQSTTNKLQVVEGIRHKAASPPCTDHSIVFPKWRRCAAPVRGSPGLKRHLNRFFRFCRAHRCAQHIQRHADHVTRCVAIGHICANNNNDRFTVNILTTAKKPSPESLFSRIFGSLR